MCPLGPLFFTLYLESFITTIIQSCEDTYVFAFADDLKLLSTNKVELQNGLSIIETWSKNWDLSLQPKKSEHLSFIFSKLLTCSPNFSINGDTIPQTNTVRDLGITVSSNLKWQPYISKFTSRANILSYNIIRSFSSSNILLYSNLYKTHIRPLLEYNTVIWNPFLTTDIKRVEAIQKRFTKMACQKNNVKFSSYEERLKIMDLDTLEMRRVRFDLIFMFKIFKNVVDIKFTNHFKNNVANQVYNLRGHNLKLELSKYSGSVIRNNFFCERIIPIWNRLPKDLAESPSLYVFKQKLKSFDITTIYASKI